MLNKWQLAHPDRVKEISNKWKAEHPGQVKEYRKKYYATHSKQEKESHEKWKTKHPKEAKTAVKKWAEAHSEYIRQYRQTLKGKAVQVRYNQTEKGEIANRKKARKNKAIRKRQLGFIPLNNYFEGAAGHHIDKERVIYIPAEVHKSIPHSVLRNRNMDKINEIAFNFLH